MHGLDFLLSNRSQLRVLRVLSEAEGPLTGRAVQRAAGLANRATMNALHHLAELRALHMTPHGRAQLYELNRNHYLVERALLPAFTTEELFWEDVARTVWIALQMGQPDEIPFEEVAKLHHRYTHVYGQ